MARDPRPHLHLEGKFHDARQATSYVVTGLLEHFPSHTIVLESHERGHGPVRRVEGNVKDVHAFLTRFCRKFPLSYVQYDFEDAQGRVATITCCCDHTRHEACQHRCAHNDERPFITISVKLDSCESAPESQTDS